jgi:two-component system cell cycle response regulator DivK
MARIVVIDDNPDNLKLVRAVLRRAGHEVVDLVTGVEAAPVVRGAEPDLVLLDLELPDRDGFAVAADLRTATSSALRIVALTASPRSEVDRRVRDAGFDGVITKPIEVTRFPGQVDRVLRGLPPDE